MCFRPFHGGWRDCHAGTLHDSLGILDAVFNLAGPVRPEMIIADTGSVSDLVFGLFAICGQFSPRIADISDARWWRFDLSADYGLLEPVSCRRIQVARVRDHWEDMLRVAGSLPPCAPMTCYG